MLIRNAEVLAIDHRGMAKTRLQDVRVEGAHVVDMSDVGHLAPAPAELIFEGNGGCLIPGLNDHHIHFLSYAASLVSARCGPPEVTSLEALARAISRGPGNGWVRGIGYHESIGAIDQAWLDSNGPDRSVRIQHRSGRQWILNSRALKELQAAATTPEQLAQLNVEDGKLFDIDPILRDLVPTDLSMVAEASSRLASVGITGFNDMTPSNDVGTFALFEQLQSEQHISQEIRLSGLPALSSCQPGPSLSIGEVKIHLHEADLPDFDGLCEIVAASHGSGRAVAIHCVTETELVFSLAALREVGTVSGDRIEHASVAPMAVVNQIAHLGVTVVTNPGFVAERGDTYLSEIPAGEHQDLYRVATLRAKHIPVTFASDAPFTSANPWSAIAAATTRHTARGQVLGKQESVDPETALAGYLGQLDAPCSPRAIEIGGTANLCLIDQPWQLARQQPANIKVQLTIARGNISHGSARG